MKTPILIINGTKDIQVPVSDVNLLHEANKESQLVIIENMNHVFKEVKSDSREDNIATYKNIELRTMQKLVDVITKIVNLI